MTTATPTKLRSGEWGAKVQGSVREGEAIQITAKSGKSWTATVERVVWSGGGVSIVATESAPRRSSYGRSDSFTYRARNGQRMGRGCSECRQLGRMCERCRFDEDDC